MQFDTHIDVPLNCNNFDDPLPLPLAPSSGKTFNLSHILVYNQIPKKLITYHHYQSQLYFVFSANQQMLAC